MAVLQESAPGRPAPHDAGRPRRLPSLTPLRFIAALAVVVVHVVTQFTSAAPVRIAGLYGYIGVTFFFLLSGFVLTWSYTGRQSAGRFWWLRFARIWPLHFVMMILAFTVVAAQERLPGTLGRIADVLLLQAWVPDKAIHFGGNDVSWSLSCELFFYLLFPLVIRGVNRLRARGIAVVGATTLAVMTAAPLIAQGLVSTNTFLWLFYVFPPYRFGEFLLGMLLARAVVSGLRVRGPAVVWSVSMAALVALVLGAAWHTLRTGEWVPRPFVDLIAVPLFALLLLSNTTVELCDGTSWITRWLPVRLGEWSFALFLVHKPLFFLTLQWGWWDNTGGITGLAWLAVLLVFVTAAGALAHQLFERPVERWLRRLPVGRTAPAREHGEQPPVEPGYAHASTSS